MAAVNRNSTSLYSSNFALPATVALPVVPKAQNNNMYGDDTPFMYSNDWMDGLIDVVDDGNFNDNDEAMLDELLADSEIGVNGGGNDDDDDDDDALLLEALLGGDEELLLADEGHGVGETRVLHRDAKPAVLFGASAPGTPQPQCYNIPTDASSSVVVCLPMDTIPRGASGGCGETHHHHQQQQLSGHKRCRGDSEDETCSMASTTSFHSSISVPSCQSDDDMCTTTVVSPSPSPSGVSPRPTKRRRRMALSTSQPGVRKARKPRVGVCGGALVAGRKPDVAVAAIKAMASVVPSRPAPLLTRSPSEAAAVKAAQATFDANMSALVAGIDSTANEKRLAVLAAVKRNGNYDSYVSNCALDDNTIPLQVSLVGTVESPGLLLALQQTKRKGVTDLYLVERPRGIPKWCLFFRTCLHRLVKLPRVRAAHPLFSHFGNTGAIEALFASCKDNEARVALLEEALRCAVAAARPHEAPFSLPPSFLAGIAADASVANCAMLQCPGCGGFQGWRTCRGCYKAYRRMMKQGANKGVASSKTATKGRRKCNGKGAQHRRRCGSADTNDAVDTATIVRVSMAPAAPTACVTAVPQRPVILPVGLTRPSC